MPENIIGFASFCILAIVVAFVFLRLITAPYFLWVEDQRKIDALEGVGRSVDVAIPKRTLLRLQFHGDLRFPTAIEEENVYSWFAYRRDQMKVDMKDADGNTIETLILSPMWCVFLVLDVEHEYRSVEITYRSSDSIQSQVRQTTPRSIVVVVEQDMPSEQFEIKTVSLNGSDRR